MFKFTKEVDLSGYTLFIPSVSVGNVGQLVADLLICNLRMEKVASIWTPAIVAIAGSDPYNLLSKSLTVSSELFVVAQEKKCVLHIRSPLARQHSESFLADLVDHFVNFGIEKVIIISSSFAHEKRSISTVPFRYLINEHFTNQQTQLKDLGWIVHDHDGETDISGGGYSNDLYVKCTERNLPCLILFKYVSEGNNAPDAIETLQYLNNWAKIVPGDIFVNSAWTTPPSWELLFGGPPPKDIY